MERLCGRIFTFAVRRLSRRAFECLCLGFGMRPFLHVPRTTRTLLPLQVFTQRRPPGIWRRGARTGADIEVLPALGTQPPAVRAALRAEGDCQDHFLPDEIVQDDRSEERRVGKECRCRW